MALGRIFGFQPKISKRIIEELGSSTAIFGLSGRELEQIFGPYSKHTPLVSDRVMKESENELRRLVGLGYQVVAITEDTYPSLLKDCDDAPACLYVRSSSDVGEIFNRGECISIVGTRDISLYGKEWCTRIVRAISESAARPAIVSGLALGVDITAHMAALDFGLPTIAVIPVGIEDIYPRTHRQAACRIVSSPGSAVVTDYPPGTAPLQINFIRRNRIIAGLSRATVLIESKAKGGGMLTARLAGDYGREVFVLPGRIDDVRSAGCNALVRQKAAEIICSPADITVSLGLGLAGIRGKQDLPSMLRARYGDGSETASVGILIEQRRGITADEICRCLNMSYRNVSQALGRLELDGIVSTDLLGRCAINAKIA